MKTLLFHGPPGCGKDTQLDLLRETESFERIGTGDMFRQMYKEGNSLGVEAYEDMKKGFVPSDLTYKLLNLWITRFDVNKDWYFVSVVRSPEQIAMFDALLGRFNRKLDHFIHFSLTEESAIERISLRRVCPDCFTSFHEKYKPEKVLGICDKCGGKLMIRADDKEEVVLFRQRQYKEAIQPILDEYRQRGVLIEVDASADIKTIGKILREKLLLF